MLQHNPAKAIIPTTRRNTPCMTISLCARPGIILRQRMARIICFRIGNRL